MNIRVHEPRRPQPVECAVSRYVSRALFDGAWTTENIYTSIGRLVELLADRGLLSAEDILEITGTYSDHPPVLLP